MGDVRDEFTPEQMVDYTIAAQEMLDHARDEAEKAKIPLAAYMMAILVEYSELRKTAVAEFGESATKALEESFRAVIDANILPGVSRSKVDVMFG